MLWLTWRQHRAQVLITFSMLLALGVFLLIHGLGTVSAGTGVPADRLEEAFSHRFRSVYFFLSWVPIVPLLIGVFWGAPVLARELEKGTHKLAWTQSVTRRQWLVAKLGLLGLAAALAGLGLGLMISAWLSTFDGTKYTDKFGDSAMFGATGVVAGAWWLFAFMLGTAAGGVLRRMLPAFAVTIAVFVLLMIALFSAREDYAEPLRKVVDHQTLAVGSYITGSASLSPAGVEVPGDAPVPECASEGRDTYLTCVSEAGYESVFYYQPADRYWRFQWTETGILLLATVALAGPVVYRVARRPI
jgi:ABC-type transport system involved in multi-copper enzyme maturation permease subunit